MERAQMEVACWVVEGLVVEEDEGDVGEMRYLYV